MRRPFSFNERLRSPGAPLLTPKVFEAWLARSGAVALRRASAGLPLPFLFGRRRVRRRLYAEICRAFGSNDRIRESLTTSLTAVPAAISGAAAAARSANLLTLVHHEASRRLVAVPRAAVVRRLARKALDALGALPALASYDGLPAFLVGSLAVEAEAAYLDSVRRDLPAEVGLAGAMIAAVDRTTDWGKCSPSGHYWVAETSMSSLDLNRESDRRRFAATLDRSLTRARSELAESPGRASIFARLLEELSRRPVEGARPLRAPTAAARPASTVLVSNGQKEPPTVR